MAPPQVHINLELLFSAGMLPISTVGEPGAHGAGVTGMQGMGVNTPMAAVVAEATAGLARLLHMPKGGMLTSGIWSMMLASGVPVTVRLVGSTTKEPGATPKLHCRVAPMQT